MKKYVKNNCASICFFFTQFRDVKKAKQSVPLHAWSGPEGSRKLRFPDFNDNGTGRW